MANVEQDKCIIEKISRGMSRAEAMTACKPQERNLVANGEMSQADVDKYIKPQLK